MKSYKEFISESINISGDFNGTMIIGGSTQQESSDMEESYTADVLWQGNLYRLELTSDIVPSSKELTEQLQGEYPGAIVQYIYPSTQKSINVTSSKRYHPSKLEWI